MHFKERLQKRNLSYLYYTEIETDLTNNRHKLKPGVSNGWDHWISLKTAYEVLVLKRSIFIIFGLYYLLAFRLLECILFSKIKQLSIVHLETFFKLEVKEFN